MEVPRKLKLIAAFPGFLIGISRAVSAQNPDDQAPDRYSMPAMKREHNKEKLVMIATHEGILSAVYCCLPAVVAGARHTTDKLASLLVPTSKITKGDPHL